MLASTIADGELSSSRMAVDAGCAPPSSHPQTFQEKDLIKIQSNSLFRILTFCQSQCVQLFNRSAHHVDIYQPNFCFIFKLSYFLFRKRLFEWIINRQQSSLRWFDIKCLMSLGWPNFFAPNDKKPNLETAKTFTVYSESCRVRLFPFERSEPCVRCLKKISFSQSKFSQPRNDDASARPVGRRWRSEQCQFEKKPFLQLLPIFPRFPIGSG